MDLRTNALWVNLAIFAICAMFVWLAGTRISRYLDAIARRTGISHGTLGLFVLGGVTSLPEMATVAGASLAGNAPLAINNMLGSIAVNLVVLASMDFLIGKDALTSVVAHSSTLLQGTLDIVLLSVVAVAIVVGGPVIWHTSVWTWGLFPLFFYAMRMALGYKRRNPWVLRTGRDDPGRGAVSVENKSQEREKLEQTLSRLHSIPLRGLITRSIVVSLVILVSGFFLGKTGDAIALQTGFGSNMVGLVLLALATGLPEISSAYSAVRLGRYEMVVGDIFGTNLWNVFIIGLADLLYLKGSVLAGAGKFEIVATLLAIILTCIFVLGLIERRDRAFLRMGYDSAAVIVVYLAGIAILYSIR